MDFKGKRILVTGATGGIGGAIVEKFLSLNASVLGTGTNFIKFIKKWISKSINWTIWYF